jgi:predicted acyl esterase
VTNDLHKYFDRFLKGIKNGWEDSTPPVRLSLLGFDNSSPAKTVLERPENEYPLARQQMQTFYLDVSNRTLSRKPVAMKCSDSYKAHDLDVSIVSILSFISRRL